MFSRHIIPVARAVRPCLTIATRGKRDLPIWNPFSRRGPWDEPVFNDFFRSSSPLRAIDDQFREAFDKFLRMSPMRVFNSGYRVRDFGANAEIVHAKLDSEGLNLKLNVSHYEPDQLKVKVVDDRLVISGKHEKRSDEHGFVQREFVREFLIPEEVDKDTLASRITEDGHLIISARVKAEAEPEGRTISIEHEEKNEKDKKE